MVHMIAVPDKSLALAGGARMPARHPLDAPGEAPLAVADLALGMLAVDLVNESPDLAHRALDNYRAHRETVAPGSPEGRVFSLLEHSLVTAIDGARAVKAVTPSGPLVPELQVHPAPAELRAVWDGLDAENVS